jgi:hypothetical protein
MGALRSCCRERRLLIIKTMRSILALNLVMFVALFIATGSPEPPHGNIGVVIDDWWVLSTIVVLAMFTFHLINKARGRAPGRLWLDGILFGAWVCVLGILVVTGSAGFIGF